MCRVVLALSLPVLLAPCAAAGPASGRVTSATGIIAPRHAIAYVVRDSRNARHTRVEVLLTDVAVDAAVLKDELDRHVAAINVEALRDRNYVLLWVSADDVVSMNATYSRTMTQYLNDTSGGLTAALATNTPAKIEGRLFAKAPLETMGGPTYTVDVTFSADVLPALTGAPLPAGGGEPGTALTAFLGAVTRKQWPAIKDGLSPRALPTFDKSYDTPAENAESASDLFAAWLPMTGLQVSGGILIGDGVAVLDVEGERFGSRVMSLVRMVKTGAAWQFDQSAPAGSLR